MTSRLVGARARMPATVRVLLLLTISVSAPLAEAQTPGVGALRLPGMQDQYHRAPAPKTLVVLDGSDHAHRIFGTGEGPRLRDAIVGFLDGHTDARHPRPLPQASSHTDVADG